MCRNNNSKCNLILITTNLEFLEWNFLFAKLSKITTLQGINIQIIVKYRILLIKAFYKLSGKFQENIYALAWEIAYKIKLWA